ncbi:MAG TPA: NADP-dependent oxidoreductase [Terriglobia bacterium]
METPLGADATMKAAAIDRFGPAAVLTLHTLLVPQPGPNEVLIALHVAGVGVWDALIRNGSWQPVGPPNFPVVPGTDGAGVVVAKGARVTRFNIGERVYASEYDNPKGGFYAEYVAVKAEHVARVPARLDFLQAGAVATTGLTALQGIDDALRLRRGETLFIYGASGAVGTLAVQCAKARRARVLATASGQEGAALIQQLGADAVINGRRSDACERLRELAPGGVDAALVLANGRWLDALLGLVRVGGRVAYPNGVEPAPRRRRGIRLLAYDAVAGTREFARLQRAVTAAKLQVPVARVYPLALASKAHSRLERGHVLGRIVLQVRSEED